MAPTPRLQVGRKDWSVLPSWHIPRSPMREQSIGAPRVARPFIFQTGYVNYSRPPHGGADRIGTERIVIVKTYDRLCA